MYKMLESCEKYWKSQGNLSVRKSGNHAKAVFKLNNYKRKKVIVIRNLSLI